MNTLLFLGNLGAGEILIILGAIILSISIIIFPIVTIIKVTNLKNRIEYLEKLLEDTRKMR